ncbi:Na(+)/H(+) antiporter subunit B [Anaerotalea alkaliphila]|uniref:DUF4040 domain-containing protein n=1 Tax=Anaerotalea alkaliphila TaxID=2662126 RepID=A0A7X5HVP1_9FIRM|nr:DUF4040 domain-containing protein [Anaerotalea alkaliphila]NDL67423.1 DUF4040 domain-containing protein [Anaerotalea alkaliphila]
MLKVFLVLMVVFAVMAVQTPKLRQAVVYLGIFSLISSFVYLLYSAPDVAIAEAVIGSTLATILYLVALKKYAVYTIYFTDTVDSGLEEAVAARRARILELVEGFCTERELEAHVIYTAEGKEQIQQNHSYDLIVMQEGEAVTVCGSRESYHVDGIRSHLLEKDKGAGNRLRFQVQTEEEEVGP